MNNEHQPSEPVRSQHPNGACPHCGGKLLGDGFRTVLHCENAEEGNYGDHEPDANPVFCSPAAGG